MLEVPKRLGITDYVVLPTNKLNPLLSGLVGTGAPVAISVDATRWSFYRGGIFTDKNSFTTNHAVTLMGFQRPVNGAMGYYLIKNSWGSSWGENGMIRVEMTEDEDNHCGWNHNSHDGLACDGDPDDSWVCGTSGVLYDSVYPTGLYYMETAASV
jgi:hypothetical protein